MSISIHKFLLILLTLGIGVQTFTFVSCTLHFPEEIVAGAASSSSEENSSSSNIEGSISSSSKQNESSSSSSEENQYSSSSDFDGNSSSDNALLSSSDIPSSSSRVSSSSSRVSSSSSNIPSSSSIALLSSSSVCTAKDNTQTKYCSGGVMKEYGVVSYEGQEYKTVVINKQTWMAANLNYKPSSGQSRCYAEHKPQPEPPWLAPNDPKVKANCDKYGRLYDWSAAMNLPASCNNSSCASQVKKPHQGVCPSGWHLPDTLEWNALRKFIEDEIFEKWEDVDFGWDVGTKLKAITGWKETSTSDKGVDSYGFGAIGSGYCVSCDDNSLTSAAGFYSSAEVEAHWWTATEYVNKNVTPNDATKAYKNNITNVAKVMAQKTEKKGEYLYSVRCVKN